ncbi:MAG: hypothetical protein R2699_19125 [Acidimicrobiales bacterium]
MSFASTALNRIPDRRVRPRHLRRRSSVVRVSGKRTLAQCNAFDFVVTHASAFFRPASPPPSRRRASGWRTAPWRSPP